MRNGGIRLLENSVQAGRAQRGDQRGVGPDPGFEGKGIRASLGRQVCESGVVTRYGKSHRDQPPLGRQRGPYASMLDLLPRTVEAGLELRTVFAEVVPQASHTSPGARAEVFG